MLGRGVSGPGEAGLGTAGVGVHFVARTPPPQQPGWSPRGVHLQGPWHAMCVPRITPSLMHYNSPNNREQTALPSRTAQPIRVLVLCTTFPSGRRREMREIRGTGFTQVPLRLQHSSRYTHTRCLPVRRQCNCHHHPSLNCTLLSLVPSRFVPAGNAFRWQSGQPSTSPIYPAVTPRV
jgi:hypothetical protein